MTEAYLSSVIPLSEYERRRREIEARLAGLENQEQPLAADAARDGQTGTHCVFTRTTLKLEVVVLVALAQRLWGRAQTLGSLLLLSALLDGIVALVRSGLPSDIQLEAASLGIVLNSARHTAPSDCQRLRNCAAADTLD